jgi:hypothetical protein
MPQSNRQDRFRSNRAPFFTFRLTGLKTGQKPPGEPGCSTLIRFNQPRAKRIGSFLLLGAALLVMGAASANAQCGPDGYGNCFECGPYPGPWTLDFCPSLINTPGISPSMYYCSTVGTAPQMPTVTSPAYSAGQKEMTTTYDCADSVVSYGAISYTVGPVQWDPTLPALFQSLNYPSFSSTAYVNVTSSDSLCPSPGRVNIGTCTWNLANPATTMLTISLPNSTYLSDWTGNLLTRVPGFIKNITFDLQGSVSEVTGQTCCSPNLTDGPSNYQTYSGTVSAKMNVTLAIPGTWWGGTFSGTSPVDYYLSWDITLGPTVTLTPAGTASASGTTYDNQRCSGCLTTTLTGSCGIKCTYGGTAAARGQLFEDGHWYTLSGSASVSVTGSASTSATGTLTGSSGASCPAPGYAGSWSIGALVAGLNASATIDGYGFSWSTSVNVFNGWSG